MKPRNAAVNAVVVADIRSPFIHIPSLVHYAITSFPGSTQPRWGATLRHNFTASTTAAFIFFYRADKSTNSEIVESARLKKVISAKEEIKSTFPKDEFEYQSKVSEFIKCRAEITLPIQV